MSDIKIFEKEEFGAVRVIMQDNDPWFVAKDIAEILEYENSRTMTRRLDEDEKAVQDMHTPGGKQKMSIINESGLYNAIIGSQKPEAKKFKKWVTSEVLPSIRKTGGFVQQDREEEFIEKYFPSFNEATKLAMVNDLLASKKRLEQKIEKDEPLVTFAQTCLKSKDNILVRELAKIAQDQHIDIGEKRLYKKLRDWKYILQDKTEPSQMAMNLGYFFVEESSIDTAFGIKLVSTTKVTPKGQVAIIQKLKKEYGE